MAYYAFIENNQIIGTGELPILNEEIINFLIDKEVYNNMDRYMWDGESVILNPNYEEERAQREREKIARMTLTKREVFLALYKDKGITPEQIKAQITEPEALIEFEYATEYYRGNPLINSIGAMLGYTSEELDYLFIHKELRNDSVG